MKRLLMLVLPFLLLLTGCNVIAPLAGQAVTPTPTDCGCSITGPGVATPTGGISVPSGPVGPVADTATPAPLESYQDKWSTYTNAAYGFSFEYPAIYDSKDFSFCAAREGQNAPENALAVVNLGSRTQLTLTSTQQDLQSAVDSFRADPAAKDFQFDAPKEVTVGGVPALTLPYRSGGTDRYAETTFLVKDAVLYRIDVGTPSACDVSELNLTEMNAYSRVLESFTFK